MNLDNLNLERVKGNLSSEALISPRYPMIGRGFHTNKQSKENRSAEQINIENDDDIKSGSEVSIEQLTSMSRDRSLSDPNLNMEGQQAASSRYNFKIPSKQQQKQGDSYENLTTDSPSISSSSSSSVSSASSASSEEKKPQYNFKIPQRTLKSSKILKQKSGKSPRTSTKGTEKEKERKKKRTTTAALTEKEKQVEEKN